MKQTGLVVGVMAFGLSVSEVSGHGAGVGRLVHAHVEAYRPGAEHAQSIVIVSEARSSGGMLPGAFGEAIRF